jgi:hypothetical protein
MSLLLVFLAVAYGWMSRQVLKNVFYRGKLDLSFSN